MKLETKLARQIHDVFRTVEKNTPHSRGRSSTCNFHLVYIFVSGNHPRKMTFVSESSDVDVREVGVNHESNGESGSTTFITVIPT